MAAKYFPSCPNANWLLGEGCIFQEGCGRADMIKGRQKSILFSSGAQLCGQILQSTNLQEEKPCVKLIMYNFLFTWATFTRSLPEQTPSLPKCSLLGVGTGMWPVPTAHCAWGRGSCGELALSCYQQALSNRFVSPNVIFAFWEHRAGLGVIQFGAQHGVFIPTEVCLLHVPRVGTSAWQCTWNMPEDTRQLFPDKSYQIQP